MHKMVTMWGDDMLISLTIVIISLHIYMQHTHTHTYVIFVRDEYFLGEFCAKSYELAGPWIFIWSAANVCCSETKEFPGIGSKVCSFFSQ